MFASTLLTVVISFDDLNIVVQTHLNLFWYRLFLRAFEICVVIILLSDCELLYLDSAWV